MRAILLSSTHSVPVRFVPSATTSAFGLAAMLAAAGCPVTAEDLRKPLGDCEHGLYWAECGGEGDPVLGCDEATGDCRWFSGGVSARGYAVSDCPTTDPCCHDGWPFFDFAPSGDVLNRARDQLSVLGQAVLTRQGVSDVSVAGDLGEPIPFPRIRCPPEMPGESPLCQNGSASGGIARHVGRSVVVTYDQFGYRVELEIVPSESLDDWSISLYYIWAFAPRDGPPALFCDGYSVGYELAVTGVLHVNTADTSDLTAFHGRLDGMTGDGVEFTIEF